MRVWTPANIDKIRLKRGMTSLGFLRALSVKALAYGLEPSNNHVRNIINGKGRGPQPAYLALFADVLDCSIDEFFVTKPEKV